MKKEYLSVTSHEFELKKSADGLVVIYRDDEFQSVSLNNYSIQIIINTVKDWPVVYLRDYP